MSVAVRSLVFMEEPPQEAPSPQAERDGAWQRLTAYAYLSAPERLEHIAIMRVFCGTLLADLAAPDVRERLEAVGGPAAALDADTLATRLDQLVKWGNLLPSTHTVKAASITEYQRARSRYQLSKLGERIQRDADEVLASADAAREVSSELLARPRRSRQASRRVVSDCSRSGKGWTAGRPGRRCRQRPTPERLSAQAPEHPSARAHKRMNAAQAAPSAPRPGPPPTPPPAHSRPTVILCHLRFITPCC